MGQHKPATLTQEREFELLSESQLWREYNIARNKFYQAQANFDNAIGDDQIDIAIYELKAAEERMDSLLREIKEKQGVAV